MVKRLGLVLVLFGMACGDSTNLLIPFAIVTVGAGLYLAGERFA